ncbi:MAG: TIGR03960 family B12-binding radical SAM protein, partial [Candidatus Eisenbacteria bacterium]|nr:TIGR03960 family B12-binding radical SAM protein [Candidatus Eisenbacteria bacterium]
REEGDPLVVGGGPCASNPEPVAPFFDLFVIGDGESAVLELSDLVIEGKNRGWSKAELLEQASSVRGFYVPSLFEKAAGGAIGRREEPGRERGTDWPARARVERRVEPSLGYIDHPSVPIVPVTETTHDRLSVEIMRGCTRGCRFCQPGMITRPARMRPIEDVDRLIDEGIACSGYDEVSLVSLSSSDYDDLPGLVSTLNERLFDRKVSVSLPSLRVDRFGLELADGIGRVRRSGLTFAPEAGTQRLRDVINKNENEESILETVDVAFAAGWNKIKLYFMIGLPTETREDLEGIVSLVRAVKGAARRHIRAPRINVSISPFVPRAHTPFQWERQDLPEETREKEQFLREGLRTERGVRLATRDPMVSLLEGVMARGDRALAKAIEAAFRAGARFDGWTETFDYSRWESAFAASGIDPRDYLAARDPGAPLPWSHLDAGPTLDFLLAERDKALKAQSTPDCRETGCYGCGACDAEMGAEPTLSELRWAAGRVGTADVAGDARGATYGRRDRRIRRANGVNGTPVRWRVRYSKGGSLRFLSHLDIVRTVLRAIAMSGLPVVYTQGFNPHPKLSFGPPLPVGSTGDAEFFDFELSRPVDSTEIQKRLDEGLPNGLVMRSVSPLSSRVSVSALAEAAEYLIGEVPGLAALSPDEIERRILQLRETREAVVPKGSSLKTVRPSDGILELKVVEGAGAPDVAEQTDGASPVLRAVLALGCEGALRPVDVARLISPEDDARPELATFHRTMLLGRRVSGPGLEPIL